MENDKWSQYEAMQERKSKKQKEEKPKRDAGMIGLYILIGVIFLSILAFLIYECLKSKLIAAGMLMLIADFVLGFLSTKMEGKDIQKIDFSTGLTRSLEFFVISMLSFGVAGLFL